MKARLSTVVLTVLALVACSGHEQATGPVSLARPTVLNAIGTDPATGATIETNQDDYVPGEVVHLAGRGWLPNETVHLFLTEDPDTHGDVSMDVQADSTGAFALHFYDVQSHDLGVTFTLTATGQSSGSVAVAMFTDGRVVSAATIEANAAGVTINAVPNQSLSFVVQGSTNTLSGTGNSRWLSTSVAFVPSPSGTAVTRCNENDVHNDPNTPASGLTTTFTANAPLAPGTYRVQFRAHQDNGCTAGQQSAQFPGPAPATQFTVIVAAPPANDAPVADAGGPYGPVAEGSDMTLDGTGSSDSDGNVVSYAWDYAVVSADAGATCEFDDDTSPTPNISCTDDGSFTLTLVVTDDDGAASAASSATLTVTNVAATVTIAPSSKTIDEGGTASFTASITDPGSNDLTDLFGSATWSTSIGPCSLEAGATATAASFTCNDNGAGKVELAVDDGDPNGASSDEADLTVNNVNPTATFNYPPSPPGVNEGSDIDLSLTGVIDPGAADVHTFAFDCGTGSGYGPAGSTASVACPTVDNGTRAVKGKVIDDDGGFTEYSATVLINNVPPAITSVVITPSAAGNIYPITQPVTVTATFTDPGALDTHQCSSQAMALDIAPINAGPSNAAGNSCTNTLSFLQAGVYDVTLTVTDKDGDSDNETIQVIVYDPSAGFVTGGGWINSPAGAYYADPSLTGKATFGFVAKYKKGATVPDGNTQFVFHAGGFNFHSAQYDFLIVNQNGTNAQYKGTGTVNGAGGYTFMLWAKDGSPDQLRIKIWVTATNAVVYDNVPSGEDGEVQAIASGSIVIHAPKK